MTTETATPVASPALMDLDVEPQSLALPPPPATRRPQVLDAPSAGRPVAPAPPAFLDRSEDIGELLKALVQATLRFDAIETDRIANIQPREGRAYTYGWASLAEINRATRAPLAENDLVIIHGTRLGGDKLTVRTELWHALSSQWLRNDLPVAVFGNDPREAGKAISYARRYNMLALLNLSPGESDDDDGESSATSSPRPQVASPPPPQPAQRRSQQPASGSPLPAAANIGKIAQAGQRGDAWYFQLVTGYVAATKDNALAEALLKHKADGAAVELSCRAPRDPKFAPTIEEVRVVPPASA